MLQKNWTELIKPTKLDIQPGPDAHRVAKVVAEYIARLEKSFACWENRLGFMDSFRISRAESGFPVAGVAIEVTDGRAPGPGCASLPRNRKTS